MTKDYQLFKEKINYNIQHSNLDIGAVYFILKNTLIEIEALYYAQINKEMSEESLLQEDKGEE